MSGCAICNQVGPALTGPGTSGRSWRCSACGHLWEGDTHGHTPRDCHELAKSGVDPESTQPRERPVPCRACGHPTWHQAGGCDRHYLRPGACDRAELHAALDDTVRRHPANGVPA